MPLDIQIGSLGAEKFNFEIHKNTHWKKYLFFPEKRLRRKLDFGSAELGMRSLRICKSSKVYFLYFKIEFLGTQ